MYADRYGPRGYNRGSMGLSVGIVGGLLATAFLASPVAKQFVPEHILTVYPVDPETPPPPPEPAPPKVQQKSVPTPPLAPPTTIIQPPVTTINEVPPAPPLPPSPLTPGLGDGSDAGTVQLVKPAPPVLTAAGFDSRYARDLQPPYPSAEERAGREGTVTLRVLIGVDGRVKQVERLTAASDEFWRVTERQALGRWRFRPATRDGIPVEGWKQMTVRFELPRD